MCFDMPEFQLNASLSGLRNIPELDAYCYTVAGYVAQMLVDLFCIQCDELVEQRQKLQSLAVSFGQGLQMTNILKVIWTDYERGACWLPRSMFGDVDYPLQDIKENHKTEAFQYRLHSLLGIAYGHLENALEFTRRIPARQTGMRRFCLWGLGMAVLTLRRIGHNPLILQPVRSRCPVVPWCDRAGHQSQVTKQQNFALVLSQGCQRFARKATDSSRIAWSLAVHHPIALSSVPKISFHPFVDKFDQGY